MWPAVGSTELGSGLLVVVGRAGTLASSRKALERTRKGKGCLGGGMWTGSRSISGACTVRVMVKMALKQRSAEGERGYLDPRPHEIKTLKPSSVERVILFTSPKFSGKCVGGIISLFHRWGN